MGFLNNASILNPVRGYISIQAGTYDIVICLSGWDKFNGIRNSCGPMIPLITSERLVYFYDFVPFARSVDTKRGERVR
jgi:hypothetical protein